ncbi:MAG: hypothetical protein JWO51_4215 [Rhodospirillales bacterium]|nr:hypothetical protein [Rhodospirillales bacterium]
MWEARKKTAWQNFRHEISGVIRQARADRRYLARDFSRLVLGDYRSRDAFTSVVARFRPKTPGFEASDTAQTLRDELLGPGYTRPLPLLTSGQVAEIREYFTDKPYVDPYRPHLGTFRFPNAPSPESNQAYYDLNEVLRAPHVLKLFNNPLVLETVELLLGCKPTLDNITCWWAFTGRSQAKGFQRFHRDFDTPRFIKLFIYLTDVDNLSGAHVFVRGSQRSEKVNVTRYIDEDEIDAAFGRNAQTTMCGPTGTCFLEDTYGIHRAGLPIERPRLILSAQYNIWPSPFSPMKPPLAVSDRSLDPWINRAYFA